MTISTKKNKAFFWSLIFLLFSTMATGQQTIGFQSNTPESYEGYTLFAPSNSSVTYLIDNCGYLVHSWESANDPGAIAVYLLEDGSLLRTERITSPFTGGGTGGQITITDWDGNVTWSYQYASATVHQHHDVEILPNGNVLVLAWEAKSEMEAIEQGRDPAMVTAEGVWPEHIVELQPVGSNGANIVWEWYLWDHLVQDFDETKPNFGVIADHPELVNINYGNSVNDWIHANSVDYNPVLDQIILCSRVFGEFWIIDHSTTTAEAASHAGGNSGMGGDLLYRWGNPAAYDRGTPADQQLFGPHDAHWIPDNLIGGGDIMIFNNGISRPQGNFSSVDVISPPISGFNYTIDSGQPFGPVSPNFIYSDPNNFYSPNVSGAQTQPNGNILICEGSSGHFFEIDLSQNIVWDYINPVNQNGPNPQGNNITGNSVFRAYRYDADYPGLAGRDLTPGDPIELNPEPYACTTSTSTLLTISCPPDISVETTNGQTSAVVNWSPATGSTTCSPNTVSINQINGQSSGSSFDIGTHTITYQATDDCSNEEICSFIITVELGNTTLTIDCPADETYYINSNASGAIANWPLPTADSNCPNGSIQIEQTEGQPNGSEFPIGSHQITYQAEDGCDNVENCSFFVDVIPTQLFLNCPANQTIYISNNDDTAPASWVEPNPNSNCPSGGINLQQTAGLANGADFPLGNNIVTYTATDDCGNEEICSFNINIISTELNLDCPENITIYLPENTTNSTVNWNEPIPQTNCSPSSTTLTQTMGLDNGASFSLGTTTIAYEANDDCNNTAQCAFTVELIETTMDLACPASQTIYINENESSAIASWDLPMVMTTCPDGNNLTQIEGNTSGSNFPIGIHPIAYQATDDCGNVENCNFQIEVIQTTLSLECPPNQTIYLPTDSTMAIVEWDEPIADTDCPLNNLMLTQTQGNSSGSSFELGITTIIYQATDDCGNDKNCSFDIEIIETNLALTCPDDILITVVTGTTSATADWNEPTITGDCPINAPSLEQVQGQPSGSSFDLGVSVIGYQAMDDCGNVVDCSFEVEIIETNLSLNCPNDVVVFTDTEGTPQIANWNAPSVNSTCNMGQITLEQTAGMPSGSTFPTGITMISFQATDDCDNIENCSFHVEIIATDLMLTCPADTVIYLAENETGINYNFENPTTTGDCSGGFTLTQTAGAASGTFLEIGSYTNSFSVTDTCQNEAICSFQITIETTNLALTCPENISIAIPQGTSSQVVEWEDPSLMTSCPDGTATFMLTSDMPSGSSFPLGNSIVNYTANDDCGNTANCEFSIFLEEANISLVCPTDTSIFVTENTSEAIVQWMMPTGSSDCAEGNFQINQTDGLSNGAAFPVGNNLVEYTATDDCDNNLSCTFQIEIIATSISLTCPENITIFIAQNDDMGIANWDFPIGNSSCPTGLNIEAINGQSSGDAFPVGISTVTYMAMDDCGNQQNCSFEIEVINTNLLLNCPDNISATVSSSTPSIAITFEEAMGTTSCPDGGLTITQTMGMDSGSEFPVGISPIGFTATDNCGNTTDCNFEIEVIATAIEVNCVENIEVYIPEGETMGIASWQLPTGTTSCPNAMVSISQIEGIPSGSLFSEGTTFIVYSLTDDCQNTELCSFSITVESVLLTVNCPEDILLQISEGDPNPMVDLPEIMATTTCEEGIASITQIAGLPSGSEFPVDTTQVVFQILDECGIEQLCSFSVIVEIVNSSDEVLADKGIKIFPNPAKEELYLEMKEAGFIKGEVSIYGVDGRLVKSLIVPQNQLERRLELDVSNLENGYYFIKIDVFNEQPIFEPFIIVR